MMRFNELSHELTALLRGYPAFVTRRVPELPPGEIPVFVFHTTEPRQFEEQVEVSVDSHSHLHRRVFAGRRLLSPIRAEDDFSPSNAVHSPHLSLSRVAA